MRRGATERYNRALSYFDPNLELPITAASSGRVCSQPTSGVAGQSIRREGGSVYTGQNGVPRELWRNELMWLPRFSASIAWNNRRRSLRGGVRDLLRHLECDESGGGPVRILA